MFGVFCAIGVISLVGIAFLSPGLGGHVGLWDLALFSFQPLILPVLVVYAARRKSLLIWVLVSVQIALITYILCSLVFK